MRLMTSAKLVIGTKKPNFSAIIFHYLNSSLPFGQKALSLHHTITVFFIIIL